MIQYLRVGSGWELWVPSAGTWRRFRGTRDLHFPRRNQNVCSVSQWRRYYSHGTEILTAHNRCISLIPLRGMQHISPKSWYYTMSRTKDCNLDNKNCHHYKKTTHLHLVPRLNMCAYILLPPSPQMCFNGVEREKTTFATT